MQVFREPLVRDVAAAKFEFEKFEKLSKDPNTDIVNQVRFQMKMII
jgi:hypothetical protein